MNNYLMGLFATDGSTRQYEWKTSNKISYTITLEMKEKELIEEIAIQHNLIPRSRKRIIANKERKFFSFEFGVKESEEYGKYLIDNKKELFNYFITLSNEEQNKMIRGMFDGDGGVCKKTQKGIRCYFCANEKDKLSNIYEYWFNKNNIVYSKYYDKRGSGAYNYNIGKQSEVNKLFNLIYNDNDFKLERKYNIFKENGFPITVM